MTTVRPSEKSKRGRPARFNAAQQFAIAAAVEFHHRNGAPLRGVKPGEGHRGNFNRTLRMGALYIVAEKLGRALGAEAVKKVHDRHKAAVRALTRQRLHEAMRELPTPLRLRLRAGRSSTT